MQTSNEGDKEKTKFYKNMTNKTANVDNFPNKLCSVMKQSFVQVIN